MALPQLRIIWSNLNRVEVKKKEKTLLTWVLMAHGYNPSYMGS
jgi:hypothetical protein